MSLIYFYSSLLTFSSIVLTILFFRRLSILDRPDGVRKIHKGEIALGGGLALFLSSTLALYLFYPEFSPGNFGAHPALSSIWAISSVIIIMGLIDDIKPIPVSIRIIIQVIASWLVIASTDVYLTDLGNLFDLGNIELGKFGIPITIFMVVGVCNAFNMLDGMDGLVAFLLLIPATVLSYIAYTVNIEGLIFLPTAVLTTFLIFNLGLLGKKWKIFLGDSGSMWLGFITSWFLVCFAENETRFNFHPVSALWFVLIPVVDAMSTFTTRLLNRKSMFDGDRTHLHHILIDLGMKKSTVLLIFIIFSLSFSLLALYFIKYDTPEYLQFYGFLTVWFFYHLLIKVPMTSSHKP